MYWKLPSPSTGCQKSEDIRAEILHAVLHGIRLTYTSQKLRIWGQYRRKKPSTTANCRIPHHPALPNITVKHMYFGEDLDQRSANTRGERGVLLRIWKLQIPIEISVCYWGWIGNILFYNYPQMMHLLKMLTINICTIVVMDETLWIVSLPTRNLLDFLDSF